MSPALTLAHDKPATRPLATAAACCCYATTDPQYLAMLPTDMHRLHRARLLRGGTASVRGCGWHRTARSRSVARQDAQMSQLHAAQ